jgi:hypothetical protein
MRTLPSARKLLVRRVCSNLVRAIAPGWRQSVVEFSSGISVWFRRLLFRSVERLPANRPLVSESDRMDLHKGIYSPPRSNLNAGGEKRRRVITSVLFGCLVAFGTLLVSSSIFGLVASDQVMGYSETATISQNRRNWEASPYHVLFTSGIWSLSLFVGGLFSANRSPAKWHVASTGVGVTMFGLWLPAQVLMSSSLSTLQVWIGLLSLPSPALGGLVVWWHRRIRSRDGA